MTRINCAPVEELTDKHLLAEYRELPRVSNLVYRWKERTGFNIMVNGTSSALFVLPSIPKTYRLGKGHVLFFYDKGEYLRRRFEDQIVPEMKKRGFTTNFTKYRLHPEGLNNDWNPSECDISINKQRILDRLMKGNQHDVVFLLQKQD